MYTSCVLFLPFFGSSNTCSYLPIKKVKVKERNPSKNTRDDKNNRGNASKSSKISCMDQDEKGTCAKYSNNVQHHGVKNSHTKEIICLAPLLAIRFEISLAKGGTNRKNNSSC